MSDPALSSVDRSAALLFPGACPAVADGRLRCPNSSVSRVEAAGLCPSTETRIFLHRFLDMCALLIATTVSGPPLPGASPAADDVPLGSPNSSTSRGGGARVAPCVKRTAPPLLENERARGRRARAPVVIVAHHHASSAASHSCCTTWILCVVPLLVSCVLSGAGCDSRSSEGPEIRFVGQAARPNHCVPYDLGACHGPFLLLAARAPPPPPLLALAVLVACGRPSCAALSPRSCCR